MRTVAQMSESVCVHAEEAHIHCQHETDILMTCPSCELLWRVYHLSAVNKRREQLESAASPPYGIRRPLT